MGAALVAPWQHPVRSALTECRCERLHLRGVRCMLLNCCSSYVNSHPAVPPGLWILNIGCVQHSLTVSRTSRALETVASCLCYKLERHNCG